MGAVVGIAYLVGAATGAFIAFMFADLMWNKKP